MAVSRLCFGAMFLGTRTDKSLSYRLLDQYVAAGGTFIDTANIYAWWVPGFKGGESEVLLGAWMKERRNRQKLFVATKVGFQYGNVPRALTAALIRQECDKSLRQMGIDVIDLYYAHVDDRTTPMEETLAAFDALRRAGKVRYLGASNFRAWRLAEARTLSKAEGWPAYCCIQQRHTFLRPRPGATFDPQLAANEDLEDYCRSAGVTMLAYSPLLGGGYTRADRPPAEQYQGSHMAPRLAALEQAARGLGATKNQVVLAWMLHGEHPVIPVVGAGTTEQLREDLAADDVLLPDELFQKLSAA